LRVVNRIEADIQQLAVQLAEIKQSIVAMVEMEPELSAEQHQERYGSCDTCYGDIRLCETYNQTHPPGTVRRDKKRGT
jgi:hypothetical protein